MPFPTSSNHQKPLLIQRCGVCRRHVDKHIINPVVYLYFWGAFCELAFTSIRRQLRTTSVENRIHPVSYFRGEGVHPPEQKSLTGAVSYLNSKKMKNTRWPSKSSKSISPTEFQHMRIHHAGNLMKPVVYGDFWCFFCKMAPESI